MINEKRVRRMARMAAYEQNDGAEDQKINAYFHGDYITKQVLLTFISATIAFAILFGAYGIYHFETLIVQIYESDIQTFLIQLLTAYAVFTGGMIAITVLVYNSRYRRARRHLNAYYQDLHRLSVSYRKEEEDERK